MPVTPWTIKLDYKDYLPAYRTYFEVTLVSNLGKVYSECSAEARKLKGIVPQQLIRVHNRSGIGRCVNTSQPLNPTHEVVICQAYRHRGRSVCPVQLLQNATRPSQAPR